MNELNRIACTTSGYQGQSLERVFAGLSVAGFRYVELAAMHGSHARIPVDDMSKEDIDAMKQLMASLGLKPVSVSGHTNLGTREGLEPFKRRIDFTRDIGTNIINTGAAHGDELKEVEQFFVNMQELVPYAREQGVRIALETHGGMTGTAQDCLRTLERIASDWVGINYDTANVIYYRGVRPEEDIKLIAPYVTHVHLKDKLGGQSVYEFPPLGQGTIDFVSIIESLVNVGYAGPYSAEIEFESPSLEAEDETMRAVWAFMSDLLN